MDSKNPSTWTIIPGHISRKLGWKQRPCGLGCRSPGWRLNPLFPRLGAERVLGEAHICQAESEILARARAASQPQGVRLAPWIFLLASCPCLPCTMPFSHVFPVDFAVCVCGGGLVSQEPQGPRPRAVRHLCAASCRSGVSLGAHHARIAGP